MADPNSHRRLPSHGRDPGGATPSRTASAINGVTDGEEEGSGVRDIGFVPGSHENVFPGGQLAQEELSTDLNLTSGSDGDAKINSSQSSADSDKFEYSPFPIASQYEYSPFPYGGAFSSQSSPDSDKWNDVWLQRAMEALNQHNRAMEAQKQHHRAMGVRPSARSHAATATGAEHTRVARDVDPSNTGGGATSHTSIGGSGRGVSYASSSTSADQQRGSDADGLTRAQMVRSSTTSGNPNVSRRPDTIGSHRAATATSGADRDQHVGEVNKFNSPPPPVCTSSRHRAVPAAAAFTSIGGSGRGVSYDDADPASTSSSFTSSSVKESTTPIRRSSTTSGTVNPNVSRRPVTNGSDRAATDTTEADQAQAQRRRERYEADFPTLADSTKSRNSAPPAPAVVHAAPSSSSSTADAGGAMDSSLIATSIGDGKTVLCKYWRDGTRTTCYSGDTCKFAHGDEELRVVPMVEGWRPRGPCKYFAKGWCKYGANCMYDHGVQEQRPRRNP
ncbi:hypothetical protein E2562_007386 [Oryza meyeriana var. granulata]|uniref:C3H1-type domain-containing protein n=1 Tax=Oryza meyeriana var. granulata TaxID=110450 RepID=A0A6G1CYS9_9ORYZ|nr:hypothetical protein E2562_007386 [Oryza meyeriana var. granulata]